MSVPTLQTEVQLKRWKERLRSLIKQSGCSQQEIAIEMAKLISQNEGQKVAETAFIASLSRFVNGKDSAFPGWFHKEESRLLPFAKAVGLQSTEPIWEILFNITAKKHQEIEEWHPAFPHVRINVSPTFQGRTIDQVINQYIRAYTSSPASDARLWIVGHSGTGRHYAAEMIVSRLQSQVSLEIYDKNFPNFASICIANSKGLLSKNTDVVVYIDLWGVSEVTLLIDQLCQDAALSSVEKLQLENFKQNLSYSVLGTDHRPNPLIWLLYDITKIGFPTNAIDVFSLRSTQPWKRAITIQGALQNLSFDGWCLFWMQWWQNGWQNELPEQQVISFLDSALQHQTVDSFDTTQVLELLQQGKSTSKKIRMEALSKLENWFGGISSSIILGHLLDTGLLRLTSSKNIAAKERRRSLHWIVQGQMQRDDLCLPFPEYIASFEWSILLWELTERGLRFQKLQTLFRSMPEWAILDVARSIVLFAAYSNQELSKKDLLWAWASVCWSEIYAIFPSTGVLPHLENSRLLSTVSKKYAAILPVLSDLSVLWGLIPNQLQPVFNKKSQVAYRTIAQIAPIQCAPTSIQEWERWPEKLSGMSAWKAIEARAELSDSRSIQLLSEGEAQDHVLWQKVPVFVRLKWLGKDLARQQTFRAFQYMLIESWEEDESLEQEFFNTAKRIGFQSVLRWMQQWATPLFIAQYNRENQQLGSKLSRCAISFSVHFQEIDLLQEWLQELLVWLQNPKGIKGRYLSWNGRSVLIGGLDPTKLSLDISAIVLFGAGQLYRNGNQQTLFELFMNSKNIVDKSAGNWMQDQAKKMLIEFCNKQLIEHWITNAPHHDQDIRRALTIDSQFLAIAWKSDKKGARRREVLSIAALQKPVPRWAILVAEREVQQSTIWPHWLSPFRREVIPIVYEMVSRSSGQDRLWWIRAIHINQSWPEELIGILQDWFFQTDQPLQWKSRTVHILSPTSTPRLDVVDILKLLKERIDLKLEEKWLTEGLLLLWRNCSSEMETNVLMTVLSLISKVESSHKLFIDNWRDEYSSSLSLLMPIWLQVTPEEELLNYIHDEQIGNIVRENLILRGNPIALLEAEYQFVEEGDCRALVDIAKRKPLYHLIDAFLKRYPSKKQELLIVIEEISTIVIDETGRFAAIRRQLILND
jgi:hypothetical protein